GRHFAVQFHPEVDGPQLKRWLDSMGAAAVQSAGLDPDQFLADTIREEPAARARADRLGATPLATRERHTRRHIAGHSVSRRNCLPLPYGSMSSELAAWLRRQREDRGWTRTELARQLTRAA